MRRVVADYKSRGKFDGTKGPKLLGKRWKRKTERMRRKRRGRRRMN